MSAVTYETYQDINTFEQVLLDIALRRVDRMTAERAEYIIHDRGFHECIAAVKEVIAFCDHPGYDWQALNDDLFAFFITDCQNIAAEMREKEKKE